MRQIRLLPLALLTAIVFAGFGAPVPVNAGTPNGEDETSYRYLNAPVDPPSDFSHLWVPRAWRRSFPDHLPAGWDPTCASNHKLRCFLRRHAAFFHLSCSDRLAGTCSCDNPHPEFCPMCGTNGHEWDAEGLKIIRRQVKIESRIFGNPRRFVVIKSPHFYLVTDIRHLKVPTRSGSTRVIGMHEIAHVFIQRAEMAYDDFVHYFGPRVSLPRPMAIYLIDRQRTAEQVSAAYFGNPRTDILYGGGATRIAGGYPFNGFVVCLQKAHDDDGLLLALRHSIGHILMSCWVVVNGQTKYLPTWVYIGVAHWLARMPRRIRNSATFCADEGTPLQNSGKHWDQRARKIAASSHATPIQKIFDVNALGEADLDMHITAWSWFKIFMEEDRTRFVKFLAELRKAKDHRVALRDAFGCTPEEFYQRWKDRVLGRRPSVAPTPAELDAAKPDRPGARERAGIRSETDPRTLAAKIRALQAVNDPLTAATIVPLLDSKSDLVRETIVLVLSKTTSDAVKTWLRTQGLSQWRGIPRAYVARVIGNIHDEKAGPELMKYTGDGFWLTRAHVARALGLLRYEPAKEILKKMVSDRSPKVRIAAMDALGRFGERAASAWAPVSDQLSAHAWQVRSAAAECLGNLGDMNAVDPLIDRMEIESGRIRKDIHEALKTITRDDLGNNPKYWREWWDKEKARAGGNLPPRGEKPKKPPKGEFKYGPAPTYYGLRVFSRGVGYVIDVSSSMATKIKLDPAWIAKQRRKYPPDASKFDLARSEVTSSLKSLDPRVRFDIYFFRSLAFAWKPSLVPASAANVTSATHRMAAEAPRSPSSSSTKTSSSGYETNYVDVFRKVLGVKAENDLTGSFSDTPDTIYFLTDGEPTTGDITDPAVLNSWFRELNRFARVKVNVITFGSMDVDPEFLRHLAEDNGGVFVQVPEAR